MDNKKNVRTSALLIISIFIGIFIGVIVSENDISGINGNYFAATDIEYYIGLSAFLSMLLGSASFVTVSFLLGFCPLAHPFEWFLSLFKGLGIGVLLRGIYSGGDILSRLCAFLPFALFSTIIFIMQSAKAMEMSTKYLSISLTNENRLGLANELRSYVFRFLIFLILCIIISALNCLLLGKLAGAGFF